MNFSQLLKDVGVIKTNISSETSFVGITEDVSKTTKLIPYISLIKEREKSKEKINEAVRRGGAVICEALPEGFEGLYVLCKSVQAANAQINSNLLGNPERELKVIGVAGGSDISRYRVCQMLRTILETGSKRCASLCGGEIYVGTAYRDTKTDKSPYKLYSLMKEALGAGDEYFIIEADKTDLQKNIFEPVTFALGIYLGKAENELDVGIGVRADDGSLSRLFQKSVISLINEDDAFGRYLYDRAAFLKYFYSISRVISDFTAQDKKSRTDEGVEYDMLSENEAIRIISHVAGDDGYLTTLAAAAGARILGVDCRDIALGIRTMKENNKRY